jgi:hypothetical protein
MRIILDFARQDRLDMMLGLLRYGFKVTAEASAELRLAIRRRGGEI